MAKLLRENPNRPQRSYRSSRRHAVKFCPPTNFGLSFILRAVALGWFCCSSSGCRSGQREIKTDPASVSTAASVVSPKFVDTASAAGLNYRWQIAGKRPLNILQTIGNGCAFLDYNGDGNLDILLVGPKLALYKGDGQGHFTDVTHETGLDALSGHFLGCAVGNYDNDGFPDIYISGYRTGVLLHNEQGKRFTDVTRQAGLKPQPWGTSLRLGGNRAGFWPS